MEVECGGLSIGYKLRAIKIGKGEGWYCVNVLWMFWSLEIWGCEGGYEGQCYGGWGEKKNVFWLFF